MRPALWSPDGVEPLPGTTYLEHLERLLPAEGRGPLPNGGFPLPDEPEHEPGSAGWWRSSLDGVMSVRGGRSTGDSPLLAAAAVLEACRNPLGTVSVHTVAVRLTALQSPQDVDRMLEAIRLDVRASRLRLAELGRWLCRFGVHAWQVKGGLALLGVSGTPGDVPLVARLGLLDAVTLYAAVALRNLLPAAEAEIFDLAKQVEGWGRIHCVLRLKNSRRPDVADWLLRGGYDSGVMVEELAYVAVTTGGLVAALQGTVDEEQLDHAGILLAAMAVGGPAEDMSDWPAGELALELYLDRMETAPASLERLSSLRTIHRYLCRDAGRNPHLSDSARVALRGRLRGVLARADWRRAVENGWGADVLPA